MAALPSGSKAPTFDLPVVGGGRANLKEILQSSPAVLVFFKISCPVCQFALPLYDRLAARLKSAGVTVLGVSQDDELSTRDFIKTYKLSFPVACDNTRTYIVSNAYGLTNVPTAFLIGQDGKIEISSVSWARAEVEQMLARFDQSASTTPLFSPKENIAEFRAG